jgi:hypothetical protein
VNERSGTRIKEVDIEVGGIGTGVTAAKSGATGVRVVEVEDIDLPRGQMHLSDPLQETNLRTIS